MGLDILDSLMKDDEERWRHFTNPLLDETGSVGDRRSLAPSPETPENGEASMGGAVFLEDEQDMKRDRRR
jgi:hypothetical protein